MSRPTDQEILDDMWTIAESIGHPRCAFVRKAALLVSDDSRQYREIGWSVAGTRDLYVAEEYFEGVFPVENGAYQVSDYDLKSAYAMAAVQSTCGVTTEAIWRYARVDQPKIYEFYGHASRLGSAVGLEMTTAKAAGCWIDGIPWVEGSKLPEPGDAMICGCSSCGDSWARGSHNTEHEFTVTSWLGGLMHSVDGGQPGVAIRSRGLVECWTGTNADGKRTGELWVGVVSPDGTVAMSSDGRPAQGRRCLGYTDVAGLPFLPDPPECPSSPDGTDDQGEGGGSAGEGHGWGDSAFGTAVKAAGVVGVTLLVGKGAQLAFRALQRRKSRRAA